MAVMVIGTSMMQSGHLNAQDPPDNNLATGTPTLIGPSQVGGILRVDTSSIADAERPYKPRLHLYVAR